jgi:thioredoxin-dependent peroxiredoxin
VLKPGDAAPDFVLKDPDGKDVRLSSFSGRPIVLYFYPKDNTAGCTIQAKGLKDHYEDISGHGAIVVGVSLDSVQTHCRFRDKHHVPFLLLADPDGRVHDLYEAWRTTLLGRSHFAVRRCTFIIDADGIIRRVYRHVNVMNHAQRVLKDLQRLEAQESWGKTNGIAVKAKAK